MTVKDILGGAPLYTSVIIGLIFIIFLACLFFKKSYARAVELGFEKSVLRKVIKSSIIFTIIPSIAIVIALFSLASVLGIPWSWFRLSVVGSLAYELMAAEMSVTGAGFQSLGDFIQNGQVSTLSTIMFVMSFSIIGGIVFNLIVGKKFYVTLQNYQEKNKEWGALAMSYFMLGLAAVFLPLQVFQGPVFIATLLSSALVAFIHIILIQKFNMKWLGEFVLANSLIIGMISSVFWDKLF